MTIGDQVEGQVCADTGARSPIGVIQPVVRFVKTQTQPTFQLVTTELEVRLHSYYMIHPPPTQTVPIGIDYTIDA